MTIQVIVNDYLVIDIMEQFREKEKETIAIFNFYKVEVLKWFQMAQGSAPSETMGRFWANHTFKAVEALFTEVIQSKGEIILNIEYNTKHADYVKYLEYDNEGRFAALPTILDKFSDALIRDIKLLYGDES